MDLATTHINADLDGLASLVALGRLEAPITLGLSGAMDPTTWRFYDAHREALPPILQPAEVAARLASEPLGRLRVADTASAGRLGVVEPYVEGFADVRCWDNHPPQDGDLPVVDMPEVGACTSALVLQMAARGIVPTATEAGLFLLGIHVDTGNFTFPTTRRSDHDAAAQCLAWGAPKSWPGRYAPKGYSVRQLVLLDRIARSVRFVDVPGTDVPLAAIELDAHEPDLAVLIEQMREAERWPAALLVVASGGGVAVIGRSDGRLDVGAVARALGGGGHTEAASAVLRGTTLGEAVALVEHTLREQWGRRRTVGEVATRRFVWAPAATTVRDAADTLHRYRINALPLTEGEGEARRFVGLVSRQELDAALRHGLTDLPAGDVSAGPPAWLPADTPLDEARAAMLDDTRRLMLVGDPAGQPVGLVTRGELFRAWEAADHVRPGPERAPGARTVLPLLRTALGERFRLAEAVGDLGAELGMAVHLVGGPVRDAMMGRPVRDLDLVVEGDAVKLARALAAARGGRVYAHEDFGTAHYVDPDGEEVDLASARVEYYERPAALPRVLNAELRRDLYRRDFTINAMAIALGPSELGRLLDPYGGLRDLHQRVLRVLHGLSFHDDPTRAFRAARFAARFDFRLAPQTATLLGAARRAGVLDALGIERLGAELDRMVG